MTEDRKTAQSRYDDLTSLRDRFLMRARAYAEVTIPTLLPPNGSRNGYIPETYSGFGARCVTSLASRLMTAMLPPGVKIFNFGIPAQVLREAGYSEAPKDMERNLTLAEDVVHREIALAGWRSPTYIALQHLIVTGNVMEQTLPDNRIRVFRLDQYVVARDLSGKMIEFIVKEELDKRTLTDDLKGIVNNADYGHKAESSADTVCLYTWGKWEDDHWTIHQEIEDKEVPNTVGEFDICPFNALRWVGVIGEDYGRSKVEEHYGDFRAIEGLSKSMLDGAAMASRHITAIRPNSSGGLNLKRRFAKANNGDVIIADPDDIGMISFENTNGLQITQSELADLRRELAAAFLMKAGVQRDAERVTAVEFRSMVEELEQVLGGVYSALVEDMQIRRIHRLILQMQIQKKLPDWPKGMVEPTILTGIEALGREKDIERVQTIATIVQPFPPEVIQAYVKWENLLGKLFNGAGVADAVRTDEEAQQIMQKAALVQALAKAGGNMMGQAAPAQAA